MPDFQVAMIIVITSYCYKIIFEILTIVVAAPILTNLNHLGFEVN